MPITPEPLTEELIREADGLFLGLLRNALIGVYIIQNGLFRYVNPRFAEMFGYAQKDICGRFGPADLIEPQDLDKVQEAIDKRIDGSAETAHYTFHGAHREGRALELEVFGTRTEFAGKPAIIGMLIDITARRAAERRISSAAGVVGPLAPSTTIRVLIVAARSGRICPSSAAGTR